MSLKGAEVTLAPLSLIDDAPRFRLGLHYVFKKHYSAGFDVGIGSPYLNWSKYRNAPLSKNYSLIEIRPEVKYYFLIDYYSALYVGFEIFYLKEIRTLYNDSFRQSSGDMMYYEKADFNREKYGFHFKGGLKFFIKKRISLDFYGGLGGAYRSKHFYNIVPSKIIWTTRNSGYLYSGEGEFSYYHLALGIKIGIFTKKLH